MARTFGPIGELTVEGVPIQLAPDLTMLEDKVSVAMYTTLTGIVMVAGVEKEILTMTGKFAVSYLELRALLLESMTIRMEIDGVEIWDSTRIMTSSNFPLWSVLADQNQLGAFQVGSSLKLFLTTTTDTDVDLFYTARKVL